MKKKLLTKKLIITLIIWLIAICLVAGGYFWLDSDITTMTTQTQEKKLNYEANQRQIELARKSIKSAEIAEETHKKFVNSADSKRDSFRKKILITKLGEITNELRAVKISFKMSQFDKYKPVPTTDKVDVMYSRVEIEYSALTDITAFKILKLISDKLNGTVYYTDFSVNKIGEIDSDVLLKISNGEIPTLVQGKIVFDWISIQKIVPIETAPPAPSATNPLAPALAIGGNNV